MASVKVVIRKKQNKDGTYPLAIRITHNRKSSYVYLQQNILPEHWNETKHQVKKSHLNSTRLNNFLLQKVADVNNLILEYELKKKPFSLEDIKNKIKDHTNSESIFEYANEYFQTLKTAQNYNRHSAEKPAISHFRRFLKEKDINFQDITISKLEGFRAYLRGEVKASERTVFNNLVVIRTLFKRALKDGIVEKEFYPFGKDKFQLKKPESLKIGLNEEEVKSLESLPIDPNSFAYHARNVWLYSFYFAGMRISDVLLSRWSDFKDGRIFYVMEKNNKPGSLKIPEKAQAILNQYLPQKRNDNDFIFPDLKSVEDFSDKGRVKRRIKQANRRINASLKKLASQAGIEKPLTMHIARHTFGNISGDRISIQMLQKLYRHSSITTTVNYQKNFLYKEADEALDKVLDF
ncbi:MAG: integrase [Bacteroidetes bacterium]|nr:MAG: integrase [Bacteroidota bacterium]